MAHHSNKEHGGNLSQPVLVSIDVPGITQASLVYRQALNQAMLFSTRAPARTLQHPAVFVRALRSALRMSQAQLAKRSGVPQAHIAHLEAQAIDVRLETLRRLFDAMFCDLWVLPRPRKRPGDAVAERELERWPGRALWDD